MTLAMELLKDQEKKEFYEYGSFELPDLSNTKTLEAFKSWDGKTNIFPTLKMKTFHKDS